MIRRLTALGLAGLLVALAPAASAMTPKTAAFLASVGLDPNSADVRMADADGVIQTIWADDPTDFSLDILAGLGRKNGVRSFVETRVFIHRLKADSATAKIPEWYDPAYLTMAERKLAEPKFRERMIKGPQ